MSDSLRALVIAVVSVLTTLAVVVVGASVVTPRSGQARGQAGPEVVRERKCPDSEFTCITLRLPQDHFAESGGSTVDVTFGLLRATDESRGVFVTLTGGPGSSGLIVADGYTDALDPKIPEQYDIVFLDQRGIGLSEPIECPEAALAYYASPTGVEDRDAYADVADRFADDCVAESGIDPDHLPYFSTRQAVEDLEAFREWLGAEKMHVYGESYGTQFAQQYAIAHPDRVAALLLDGPVDLTRDGFAFYQEQAQAFTDTLVLTLDACAVEPTCDTDAGGDPLEAYDALAADLAAGPATFDFVTAHGEIEERQLSLGLVEAAAGTAMYSPVERQQFQRALTYAARGDLLPVARLAYLALGQDPETLEAIPTDGYSDALYYAVECTDFLFPGATEAERVAAFFDAAAAAGVGDLQLGDAFFGDLPCAFWPARPSTAERPPALTDTPFPVWVMASNADPATPYSGALRIFERLTDGYLIVQDGGPHVIFGRGDPCPDDPVTAFLLTGERPDERRIDCAIDAVDPYIPIPEPALDDHVTTLDALQAVDDEISFNADYWWWDGFAPLTVGCLHGGSIAYLPLEEETLVRLRDCQMMGGLALTGSGSMDDINGTFDLSVTAPGGTDLAYVRDADGATRVEGELEGQPVAEEEPAA